MCVCVLAPRARASRLFTHAAYSMIVLRTPQEYDTCALLPKWHLYRALRLHCVRTYYRTGSPGTSTTVLVCGNESKRWVRCGVAKVTAQRRGCEGDDEAVRAARARLCWRSAHFCAARRKVRPRLSESAATPLATRSKDAARDASKDAARDASGQAISELSIRVA